MGIFGGLFKKEEVGQQTQEKMAPGTSIRYEPELIPKLKNDHASLLTIWGNMAKALDKGDAKTISGLLSKFKSALNNHLLTENVKLYVYLTQHLADDPYNSEIIKEFRSEMNTIGRTVTTFLRTYTSRPIKDCELDEFRTQFEAIGEALVDRIEREENTLYELYLQDL